MPWHEKHFSHLKETALVILKSVCIPVIYNLTLTNWIWVQEVFLPWCVQFFCWPKNSEMNQKINKIKKQICTSKGFFVVDFLNQSTNWWSTFNCLCNWLSVCVAQYPMNFYTFYFTCTRGLHCHVAKSAIILLQQKSSAKTWLMHLFFWKLISSCPKWSVLGSALLRSGPNGFLFTPSSLSVAEREWETLLC